jgi:superfamily II DNA/RNA helicase
MNISELSPSLQHALSRINITELSPEIEKSLKKLKSGLDFVFTSSNRSEEILLICIHLISKLKDISKDDVPRALILINGIDSVFEVDERLKELAYGTELRMEKVHDKANRIQERNDLFDGSDIVIGNPKRVIELYFQNGINLKLLKHIVLFDAHETIANNHSTKIIRLFESIEKCQKILFTKEISPKLEEFTDNFLSNPEILDFSKE